MDDWDFGLLKQMFQQLTQCNFFKDSPNGASLRSSMNRRRSGCFKTFMLFIWVSWYLNFLSALHKSERWRPGLACKCMCGLARDIKDLHSIVLPVPDSPTRSTGCWASRSMSSRYACISYYIKDKKYRYNLITCWMRKNIILMLICTLWDKRQTWGTDVKKSCGLLRLLQLMKLVVSLISLNSKKCSNTVPSGGVSTSQWLLCRASRAKRSKCGQCLQWEQAYYFIFTVTKQGLLEYGAGTYYVSLSLQNVSFKSMCYLTFLCNYLWILHHFSVYHNF